MSAAAGRASRLCAREVPCARRAPQRRRARGGGHVCARRLLERVHERLAGPARADFAAPQAELAVRPRARPIEARSSASPSSVSADQAPAAKLDASRRAVGDDVDCGKATTAGESRRHLRGGGATSVQQDGLDIRPQADENCSDIADRRDRRKGFRMRGSWRSVWFQTGLRDG